MKAIYSEGFVEQALVKLYSRGDRTIESVAAELHINCHTLKGWMKRKTMQHVSEAAKREKAEKRPQDWSAAEQLSALQESHALSSEALNAWCRERGLFAHHLSAWRAAFCREDKAVPVTGELRGLKAENEQLKRALARKEKALAEAAALLILQKKFQSLWEDEVK